MLRTSAPSLERTLRRFAALASLGAAGLYLLVGLEVVTVSTDVTATSDIFTFGAVMAAIFVGVAVVLLRWPSPPALLAVALVQVITLVGYVAVSSVRTPPYEPAGLAIKALQLAILVIAAYLVLARPRTVTRSTRPTG